MLNNIDRSNGVRKRCYLFSNYLVVVVSISLLNLSVTINNYQIKNNKAVIDVVLQTGCKKAVDTH